MKFVCTHYVNTPPDAEGQHVENLNVPVDKSALLLVNVYGLLLAKEHPARQALVTIYGSEEVNHREELVRNKLLPVMRAARKAGMPVIYLADSAPNIGMEKTHIRDLMVRNLHIDPVTYYAEGCNDPLEYHLDHTKHIAYAQELQPQESDFYIRKWVYSGFHATWLDRLLRNLSVDALFCEGHWAGYRIILLRGCHAAVHVPQAEPEMGFTQRLEMYAEASLGFTITPENFCTACGVLIGGQATPVEPAKVRKSALSEADIRCISISPPYPLLPAISCWQHAWVCGRVDDPRFGTYSPPGRRCLW